MWETFLNILAIVGVVIVGAIIIYLVSYLVINGLNKNNTNPEAGLAKTQKKDKAIRPTVLDTNELDNDFEAQKQNTMEQPKPEIKAESKPAPLMWDDDLANKEKQKLVSEDKVSNGLFFNSKPLEPKKTEKDFEDFDDIFNEKSSKSAEISTKEIDDLITKINIESVAEYTSVKKEEENTKQAKIEASKPKFVQPVVQTEEDSEYEEEENLIKNNLKSAKDFDDFDEIEEVKKVQPAKEEEFDFEDTDYEEEKAELDKERQEIEQEQAKLEAEREDLQEQRKQLEEEKQRLEELRAEHINSVSVSNMTSIYSAESLEQLKARLELLNERLKSNKKDLRDNRREYGPLAKVKKALDKDKSKLTRREAIVARQKVILYGVNNYVDIDEEKAKRLNEDLDLLDGLRLSVQHCEDVINANKDRFPILEKTNRILRKVNEEILSDIAEVEKAIAEKEASGE